MKKRTKKGFTLIELIVVITILAILAIIAIPTVTGWVEKANLSVAEANGRTLELAVKAVMTEDNENDANKLTKDDVLTRYGLDETDLTNGGDYSLVVSTSGAVEATVSSGGISGAL